MDALEMLVRDALAEHAGEAPSPGRLVLPDGPSRRRWPYVALAAAAVVAVAVGILVVRDGSHSAAPAAPRFAPIPPGLNEVSYHGITLQVPDNLPLGPTAGCEHVGVRTFDPHAASVSCGHISIIPAPMEAGTLVVLSPYQDQDLQELGGPLAPRPNQTLDLRRPGVSVYVEAPTRREVRAIIGSVRITPVDRNGCAATLKPLHNPPASSLLPGHPTAAGECVYTDDVASRAFLLQSLRVDPGRVGRLVEAVQELPSGAGRDDLGFAHVTRYVFGYADGGRRVIEVRTDHHPATVTDGQHVAHDPDNAIAQAFD